MAVSTVFTNVLIMIFYMACGYILVKIKKAASDHAKSLAGVLIYVCGPCMVISSFQSMPYSMDIFKKAMLFFAVSIVIMLVFYGTMVLIFRKRLDQPKYRMLTVASIMGNVGFFGLPVITGIFPNEPIAACYSTLYTAGMSVLAFSIGVFMLTKDKKHISIKHAFFNPSMTAAIIAVPFYLLQIKFPQPVSDTLGLLGKMTTPVCMIVLGMRLSSMKFSHVFTRGFAYVACIMKLIVFPLFAFGCVYFIPGIDSVFKISLCILSSAPTAAILLSLAEQYECERKICANVVLISTLGSLITMPLIALLVG